MYANVSFSVRANLLFSRQIKYDDDDDTCRYPDMCVGLSVSILEAVPRDDHCCFYTFQTHPLGLYHQPWRQLSLTVRQPEKVCLCTTYITERIEILTVHFYYSFGVNYYY